MKQVKKVDVNYASRATDRAEAAGSKLSVLSTSAYTFRQKARLAVSLAWVGGFVDAVGFLVLLNIFTSNMTGNTAQAGRFLAELQWRDAFAAAIPVVMFFSGAAFSGLLTTGGARMGIRSVYALALSFEVAMLGIFVLLAHLWPDAAIPETRNDLLTLRRILLIALPSFAMGLQNATITQIAGAVVRTTHVTGVLTDLGLESVQFLFFLRDRTSGSLRERLAKAFYLSASHPSLQRLFLLLCIWSSFLAGCVLGAWAVGSFGVSSLLGPICFLAFMITLDVIRPIADIHAVDHRHEDQELARFGIDPGLLPGEVGVFRIHGKGRKHRAPDLGRLAERIGAAHPIVMLILADEIELDDNNLSGLHHSLLALRSQQRHLVLCVTRGELFIRIQEQALGSELGPNLCSDPEFAVARTLELIATVPTKRHSQSVVLPTF